MTVREHLKNAHATIASHHHDKAEFHRTMATCHKAALGKAGAGDPHHDFHKSAAAAHEGIADKHDAAAATHEEMCQECQKGVDAADLTKRDPNALVPTAISAIAPPPGHSAVPRHGAAPMQPAKPNVPTQFEKFFVVEEDEEEVSLQR